MKKVNKLIAVLLALSLMLSYLMMVPMTGVAAEMTASDVAVEGGLLTAIGVLSEIPDAIDGNKNMTRAEFVYMAGKLCGYGEGKADKRYFEDIPMDHWAAVQINGFTDMGIISLPREDRLFNPGNDITENEAVKILVSVLGYGNYAAVSAGYPMGYSRVASRLGFTYTGSNNTVTKYQAIVMMYETVNSCIYDVARIEGDNMRYEESDETLLSRYFDVYALEGVVTQSQGVALTGDAEREQTFAETKKILMLDEKEFTTTMNFDGYLGRMVKVYYKQKDKNEIPNIVFREECQGKDRVLDVDFEYYKGFSNGKFEYYDKNSTLKSENIPAGAVVVYNGAIAGHNVEKALALHNEGTEIKKKGKIRLIDSKDDGAWDYVIVEASRNMLVLSKDTVANKIYDDITKGYSVELDEADRIVNIQDRLGNGKSVSDIVKGQLLTIYDSGDDYIKIVINGDGVTGTVFGVKVSGTDNTLSLNIGQNRDSAVWYNVDKTYYENNRNKLTLKSGSEITYYLDYAGEVGYIEVSATGDWKIGYLVGMAESDSAFENYGRMKLFMQDGTMQIYDTEEKVRVDGVRRSGFAELENSLDKMTVQHKDKPGDYGLGYKNPSGDGASGMDESEDRIIGQVLRIRLNSDGKIAEIDTEYYNEGVENEMSLQRTFYRKDGGAAFGFLWKAHCLSMKTGDNTNETGFNLFYDADTVKMTVPTYDRMLSANDAEYGLTSGSGSIDTVYARTDKTLSEVYDAEGFKIGTGDAYEDIIVVYDTISSSVTVPCLVGEVVTTMNGNGDVVEQADFYTSSGTLSVLTAKNENSFEVTVNGAARTIVKGDIVQCELDALGQVTKVTKLYHDYQTHGMDLRKEQAFIYGEAIQAERDSTVCAVVKRYLNDVAFLRYPNAVNEQTTISRDEMTGNSLIKHDYAAPVISNAVAWVFDGKNITKSAVVNEIVSAEAVGVADANACILNFNTARINGGIFFKEK